MNSLSRARDTTANDEPVPGAGGELVLGRLAESIIYVCALIADRPRTIDRCIDYFGETRPVAGVAARVGHPDQPHRSRRESPMGRGRASKGHERHERLGGAISRQEA